MRFLPALLCLPLMSVAAYAQTSDPPAAAPAPAAASAPVAAPAPAHHRMSWKERFAQANVSHDGHLTLEQARQGYVTIARHFHAIDASGKGYVTLEDIDAWHKQQREARHAARSHADDSLRPRPAMHRTLSEEPRFDAPTQPASALPFRSSSAIPEAQASAEVSR
jgi:hypothetical protein